MKRFHTYLQGIPFKIVTDCDSFRLTLAKKDVVPRIMRWCLLLQNYQYTVEHRPNIRMQHVDALSRVNHVLILEGNTLEQTLAYKQMTDKDIVDLRESLEKSEHPLYELRNGLVYRKYGTQILFYVPQCMEFNIIYTYHTEMGHYGVDKTLELITRTYWFPRIRSKIQEFISNCLKCIEFNRKPGKQEGYLNSIPKGNLPFDTVHVDHYGPLPTTRRKRKYIFEIIDGFTKFIKLYPCKTTSAQEVIKCLCSYMQNYSRPKIIISDRGSCFTSNLFKEFTNDNGIKHILIAAGAPRSNGQIERMNSIITPTLSKLADQNKVEWDDLTADLADQNKVEWDDLTADVEFGMNNTVNRATGETPSKLLFGRDQLGKIQDNVRETLETIIQNQDGNLEEIRAKAEKRIVESQTKNEESYNKRRRAARRYDVGQHVMLSNIDTTPGVNKKLIPKYRGPYQIKAVLPNDRYLITDIPGFQNTQIPYESVLDASRLKPCESKLN
ncbi:hypothetical protein AMK59_3213 [Oryctes borbonicus]|uniref:RNA-directed DNA polymerase n=1 Tax=Oryctes borbonicus TaxID=1629725 RepID=A0A0T6B4I6_9SCAR|nr:hypothetical protein AMK59_3213 [Oryctes borbonicus]